MLPYSSSASNLEAYIPEKVLPEKRVSFVPNVSFGEENVETAEDLSFDHELETEGPTPVRAHFELPHFSIKLCGELNKVEHDFVDIMFYDLILGYEHTKPTVTLIDVSLGGLLVEDLLQEHDSPYRHLISSSAPRQFHLRERSLSAYPSSLSTSCPVVSDAGLRSNFSSSLPHCLSTTHQQSPCRSLAPLRPLMETHKFSSLPSVNASIDSDSSVEDVNIVLKEKKRNNLVHIQVLLVDKKDDEFSTKHNSVGNLSLVIFLCQVRSYIFGVKNKATNVLIYMKIPKAVVKMTAALGNRKPAVVFMKVKERVACGKKMEKSRPRLIGLKQHNRK